MQIIHLHESQKTTLLPNDQAVAKDSSPSESSIFQKAINATSTFLYQEMCERNNINHKNFIFFTPTLLASLSMLYAGAQDESSFKNTLEQALHMGDLTEEKWHRNFQSWTDGIQQRSESMAKTIPGILKADKAFKFQNGQAVTIRSDLELTTAAKNNLMFYNPDIFAFENPEEARSTINSWVAKKTDGKIENLVEYVDPKLVMIMASAALFKGQWKHPFDPKNNSVEVFTNSDGSKVRVPMMNMEIDQIKMAHDSKKGCYNVEIVELPFHGDISLLLVKSESNPWSCQDEPADQLKSFMTEKNVQKLLDKYNKRFRSSRGLSLGIPKLDLKEKVDLLKELAHTELAKQIVNSDLSCMFENTKNSILTPEFISEVQFVMDEEGASVAAASYTPSNFDSCDPYFKLCGPFGMVILDRNTQTILGMGQVLKMDGEPVVKKNK